MLISGGFMQRTGFASGRTIKHDPGSEVISKLLESMYNAGGYEKHISRGEGMTFFTIEKVSGASNYYVNFVTIVRLLGISSPGCVDFNFERTVFEQDPECFALFTGQLIHGPFRTEMMLTRMAHKFSPCSKAVGLIISF
jgi:hypothetical protein